MKKFLIGCSFAVVVAVVVAFGADGGSTNFSGTWVLDKAKSQGLPPQMENFESYTMIVSQDGTQLTVENKIAGGRRPDGGPGGFGDRPNRSSADPGAAGGQGGPTRPGGGRGGRGGFGMGMGVQTFKLDGTETQLESRGGRGGGGTLKAQWADAGKALELTTTRNFSFQGNESTRTVKDHWELSNGGKVLTVRRTADSPQGPRESTLVFNKQ